MPNNRRPKLAPGSRWDEIVLIDSIGLIARCEDSRGWEPGKVLYIKDGESESNLRVTDALAAIRAAELDPVFDSAVALSEYWDGLNSGPRSIISTDYPELVRILDANSAAVKGATDAV